MDDDFNDLRAKSIKAGFEEGKQEGLQIGRVTERARLAAILCSEEAENRMGLATRIAMETAVPADIARFLLSSSPAETEDSPPWGAFGSAEELEMIAAVLSQASLRRPQ